MSSQYIVGCSFRTGVEISLESLLFALLAFLLFINDIDHMLFFVLQYLLHQWMHFICCCTPKIKIAVTLDQQCLLLLKCNCQDRQGVIQRGHGAYHCLYLIFTGCFRLSWINQYQIQLHHEKLAMETLLPT